MDRHAREQLLQELDADIKVSERRAHEHELTRDRANALLDEERLKLMKLHELRAYVDDGEISLEAPLLGVLRNGAFVDGSRRPPTRVEINKLFDRSPDPKSVSQITMELLAMGWQTESNDPESIVRTTLHRMTTSGELEQLAPGTYLRPPKSKRRKALDR